MFVCSGAFTAVLLCIIGQLALKTRVRKYFAHHLRKSTANIRSLERNQTRKKNVKRVAPDEEAIELQPL